MVLLKITLAVATAALLFASCGSGNGTQPPHATNQTSVGIAENSGAFAGETPASFPDTMPASIATEETAPPMGAGDAFSTDYEACLTDFHAYWDTFNPGYMGNIVVKDNCKHLEIQDSSGNSIFELKLEDNDCRLNLKFLRDSLIIDTSFVFCSTGD